MTTINSNIRPASFNNPTSALSSIESLLQSPGLEPLKSLLSSLLGGASSFGGTSAASGGGTAGALPSPTGRISGAGSDIAGPGLSNAASVFQQGMSAVSGAGAGTSAVSGGGAAEIPQASYATGDKVKDDYMNSLDPQMRKQVEYQEKVQKMTEAFTLISNILKMLHDAAQAWAGNLK